MADTTDAMPTAVTPKGKLPDEPPPGIFIEEPSPWSVFWLDKLVAKLTSKSR